jgi:hypothetical protein
MLVLAALSLFSRLGCLLLLGSLRRCAECDERNQRKGA